MPPDDRPIPRFVAEPPQEALPYGRWAETLAEHFLEECRDIDADEDIGEPGPITWFPDRTYGGRTYVPATAPTSTGYELFGYVSFVRDEDGGEAREFFSVADYTDETAEANPDWRLDISDQEIATWRGTGGIGGGKLQRRAAQTLRGVLRRQHVQVHAGPELEPGELRQPRQ